MTVFLTLVLGVVASLVAMGLSASVSALWRRRRRPSTTGGQRRAHAFSKRAEDARQTEVVQVADRKEVTTRMPVALAELLRGVAEDRGVTVNDFIVQAIKAELAREPGDAHERLSEFRRAQARQALLSALDELLPPESEQTARAS